MELTLSPLTAGSGDALAVEVVERKGLGHPDSICDALAEQLSVSLSRFYLEQFGLILHHNVDKALLWGGTAKPAFGGGDVTRPIEIFLTGRAIREYRGVTVPVEELVVDGSRRWLRQHMHALDADRHIEFHCLVRPGSADLVELFQRQSAKGLWLANDTSCGVGYAPFSELETVVYRVETRLNSADSKSRHPAYGEDIKVMGTRHGDRIDLTIGCALVDRFVRDLDDYLDKKRVLADLAAKIAADVTRREVSVAVNTADDPRTESIYLTVTGTSAEAGDDGEAGRGNRSNGLITPYRPMTMESVAGKNPITHVGKLYNVTAGLIAAELVDAIDAVSHAECVLVSQIGRPIHDPQIADIRVRLDDPGQLPRLRPRIDEIVGDHLARTLILYRDLINGRIGIDRWPLYTD